MSINSPKDVLYVLPKGRTMQFLQNTLDNFFFFVLIDNVLASCFLSDAHKVSTA